MVVSDILPIDEVSDILPIDEVSDILDIPVSTLAPMESPVVVVESPVEVLDALSLQATKAPIARTNKSFFIVMIIDFLKVFKD